MASSNNEPSIIDIDWGTLRNGKVDILVHWDINEKEFTDEFSGTQTYWEYQERRMNWVLPSPMTSKEEIQGYFDDNYDEGENILGWAKASKINDHDVV